MIVTGSVHLSTSNDLRTVFRMYVTENSAIKTRIVSFLVHLSNF